MSQETQWSNTVAQVDHHNSIPAGKLVTPIKWRRGGTGSEPAAMNQYHDRSLTVRRGCRSPYVQIKAVFAYGFHWHGGKRWPVLHALRLEPVGWKDTAPVLRGLRRSPPQRTDWRGGERNALVDNNVALMYAADRPTA